MPQGNLSLVHTRLSLRTQSSLSVKAEVLYWQQQSVLAELEECDKVLGATVLGASSYYQSWQSITDELPASNVHTGCFCWKGTCAHKCTDMHGSCLQSIWVRSKSGHIRRETVTPLTGRGGNRDMEGDERRSWEGWEHGHCLRAAPISLLESDQSTGMNTQIHTFTQNCASSAALIRVDMPFILLLLEHTPNRRQVNHFTGYHTVTEHILDQASVYWHQNVCTDIS